MKQIIWSIHAAELLGSAVAAGGDIISWLKFPSSAELLGGAATTGGDIISWLKYPS